MKTHIAHLLPKDTDLDVFDVSYIIYRFIRNNPEYGLKQVVDELNNMNDEEFDLPVMVEITKLQTTQE